MNETGIKQIPAELENFDRLPNSANVKVAIVAGVFGVAIPTVWNMSRDGRLPRPRRLSARHTAWNVGELRQTLAAL